MVSTEDLKMILPFNFERINQNFFISNDAGFNSFLSEKDFLSLIDDEAQLDPETLQQLKKKFFIASEENARLSIASLSSGLAKKITSSLRFAPIYMIVPTLRCDHGCKYCQVSRAPLTSSNHDIDETLIPKIVKKISLKDAPYKIEVQGGEPLVRFDLVKKIYDECQEQLGTENFEFIVATSLSLLNDAVIDWAKERKNIYFSTSLDGNKMVHDANRLLPNASSYDKVSNSIKRLVEELGGQRVSTVTTATSLLMEYPSSILEQHLLLGLKDMFVRPISPYGFANKSKIYTIKEYMFFYKKLFYLLIEEFEKGNTIIEHSAKYHYLRIFSATFDSYADLKSPSGLVLNTILFNYDGKVYGSDESRMLQATIEGVDFSAGKIEDFAFNESEYYRRVISESFNLIHPGCNDCAYQPYCGSEPTHEISVGGEPVGDKSRSSFCEYHKKFFSFLIEEYFTNNRARKMVDSWLYG